MEKGEDTADRTGLTVQARLSSSTQIRTCGIRVCYYGDGNQRYHIGVQSHGEVTHCPGESDHPLQPALSDLVNLYL